MTELIIDASAVVEMLGEIRDRMSGVRGAVEESAQEGAPMVTVNVANYSGRSTGALAGSIVAEGSAIGSDLDYARFVFTGQGRGPMQEPEVPEDRIADVLAERVAEVLLPE